MSNDLISAAGLIKIIDESRQNALKKVNEELINMYWKIGELLSKESEQASFGDAYIDRIASEIQEAFERRLSQAEYLRLLMEADTTKRQIRKNRYCLTYENQYFEIDIYPFWEDKAIVEIELSDESAVIQFPEEIKVIKEVTDDESYKNASLAAIN